MTLLSTLKATCGTIPDLVSVEGKIQKVTGHGQHRLGDVKREREVSVG